MRTERMRYIYGGFNANFIDQFPVLSLQFPVLSSGTRLEVGSILELLQASPSPRIDYMVGQVGRNVHENQATSNSSVTCSVMSFHHHSFRGMWFPNKLLLVGVVNLSLNMFSD